MKLSNLSISSIIFLLTLQIVYPNTLSGIIYDDNQKRLDNALILLSSDVMHNTITDAKGEFLIENIEKTVCSIEVSHIGFQNYAAQINLNELDVLEIALNPKVIDLDRIVVTGTRSERHIKETPMLTHVINRDDIENSTYSNVKDILEIAMPNVEMVASNHSDDRVKIQGLDNKYLTFLVDGDRVSGEYAGNIDFSMFSLSNVDKIEVVEGAMSTLYGSSAMGGVVNIITKQNNSPFWFDLGIQYDNPFQNSESLNIGFNRAIFNYNFNIQHTHTDGYDLTPNQVGQHKQTLEKNKSEIFNHKLTIDISEKHDLQLIYKDYFSMINRNTSNADDTPMNRYADYSYKFKYNYTISDNRIFKLSYINEEYTKYYYYPALSQQFINGVLNRDEINLQYNVIGQSYQRLFGVEIYHDDYSSFTVGAYPSIFSGEDGIKRDYSLSIYINEERILNNDNILSFGLRALDKEIIIPSILYLMKRNSGYNYRFSYSSGYRNPSIKELYYQWLGHNPHIYGNPNLKPSENNYFSFSIDKRTDINDFSVDFYKNDIKDMISTAHIFIEGQEELHYKNYEQVIIHGINVHYYRKITDKLKLKFVYNLTDAESESNEILEGISKHALRLNLNYAMLNRMKIITSIKYSSRKNMFDQQLDMLGAQQTITNLSAYSLVDMYMITSFNNIVFKVGIKNIFNYKDSRRFNSEILNNYDPGRRFFIELKFKFKRENL